MARRSDYHRSGVAVSDHSGNGDGPDLTGLVGELIVGVGQLTERVDRHAARQEHPRIPWEACHPVWFTGQIPLTGGAGTLGITQEVYGPNAGFWWDVRSMKAWGFTAGSVAVFKNNLNGEQISSFPTAGENTWGLQNMLGPQDGLIWQATGITGVVNVSGLAWEILAPWLPEYAM